MEELQDAIEDAQYVNAIATQEEGPRPVLSWEIPTEEQLSEWETKLKSSQSPKGPEPFGIDWCLQSAIGLFLFSAFLKEKCDDFLRINFVEEVIRWRKMKGKHRLERAKKIAEVYLKPLPIDEVTGEKVYPEKTQIDEYDLIREVPNQFTTVEELQALYSANRDETQSKNCLGISGPILDEVFETIKATERLQLAQKRSSSPDAEPTSEVQESGDKQESASHALRKQREKYTSLKLLTQSLKERDSDIPDNLFEKVDMVVIDDLRRKYWQKFIESEQYTKLRNFLWFQDRPVVPDDFFTMRVLGRGGFGSVIGKKAVYFVVPVLTIGNSSSSLLMNDATFWLLSVTACKKGTSGKLYAMKVMNKKRIKLKKAEQLALNERKSLAAVESPFVVNLKYSFHSKDDVFLILDLMTGGDLGYHLHQKGRFPKKECQYYAARIMLGLQALHDQGYVYRDLKPENCLLAEDGRVKITDLGLATKITPTLHGAAGTRGYWAPEMLRRDEKGKRMTYGHAVDWFSFGCCVAEFISGANPFRSEAALHFGQAAGKDSKVRFFQSDDTVSVCIRVY
jgi:tRNA A-37 threonylcarbamoyl transferase component Bud32